MKSSRLRIGNEAESRRHFGALEARQPIARLGVAFEIAVIEQRDAGLALDQHRTFLVLEYRSGGELSAAVVHQPAAFMAYHQRRVGEAHVDALRSVLEEPAALRVASVVARDELLERPVADSLPLDTPVSASVELEPAVDRRHVR